MYQTALITGASAGIGKVFAEVLSTDSLKNLILVARREERLVTLRDQLAKTFKGKIHLVVCDLRQTSERENLKKMVDHMGVTVDLLINNAGFGYVGKFMTDDPKNQREMIETNCIAPVHLTQLFVPQMKEAKKGGIINVASVAAYPPLPYMATYGATKAFLLNWSVSLSQELKADGIRVSALCPGPTESEFHLVAGVKDKIEVVKGMAALPVVQAALNGLYKGKPVVVPGIQNKLLVSLTRIFSKSCLAWLGEKILRSRVPEKRS
jgi:hypothetical protein